MTDRPKTQIPTPFILKSIHHMWQYIPVISALGTWKQEDQELKVICGYVAI